MIWVSLLLAIATDDGAWPTRASGWVALFVSIGTAVTLVVGSVIAYGKWLSRMNGLGRRVKAVEDDQVKIRAVQDERGLQFERLLTQHEALIEAVAGAKKSAEQCSNESEQHAMFIGSKVDELKNAASKMELSISQRLTVVETKIDIMTRERNA
jgi:hypothetical protein